MAIKEADQIRTKSQKTNLFQSADYKRLWNSILENDIKEWKSVGKKLMKFIIDLSEMCVFSQPSGRTDWRRSKYRCEISLRSIIFPKTYPSWLFNPGCTKSI